MFRSGGSEYAINGNPCRLLDVQELLSDSGIGREMHVIVGQGQLDSILHATPEDRRGFIEEAAGVLKHRKRKEKALRKLDSTDGNLTRLSDLLTEIRRQLKPLGRQAEVARQAAAVQADVRDARARLMADDLVTARTALEQELADESILVERREQVEAAIGAGPRSRRPRWRPRCARTCRRWRRPRRPGSPSPACGSGCAARSRWRPSGSATPPAPPSCEFESGRDPETLEAEAARVQEQERAIGVEIEQGRAALEQAVAARRAAEDAAAEEERRVAGLQRAAADRREGLARLHGQVNALKSRAAAADDELGRLSLAREEAARPRRAARSATSPRWRPGSPGSTRGRRASTPSTRRPSAALADVEERLAKIREEAMQADRDRASLAARKDALELGLNRKDGVGALLAASDSVSGLLGSVAALLTVRPGYETAVAARARHGRRRRGRPRRRRRRRRAWPT